MLKEEDGDSLETFALTTLTWALGQKEREVGQNQRSDVQWKGKGPEQGGTPGVRCVARSARQKSVESDCRGVMCHSCARI